MLPRVLLLFLVVPIVELALLIQVGRWVGLWPTIALVAVTGLLGATLASREGLRTWQAFQLDIWEGRVPGQPILDGLSVLVGGALLLTPGLMTDLAGFVLLFRPTRRWIHARVIRRLGGMLARPSSRVQMRIWFGGPGPIGGRPDSPGGREVDPGDGARRGRDAEGSHTER